MVTMRRYVLFLLSCGVAVTHAGWCAAGSPPPPGETKTVHIFGLPLGGKFATPPKMCPSNSDAAKAPCWVEKPRVSSYGTSGVLHMPNPSSRPKWAEYITLDAYIGRNLTLLSLKTESNHGRTEIIDSISARFGRPIRDNIRPNGISSAEWDRSDIRITMLCDRGGRCFIDFMSDELREANARETASRAAIDAARPRSP